MFVLILVCISCEKQSGVDCLKERLDTIERYDILIGLSSNTNQKAILKEEKAVALSKLDC